MKIPKRRLPHLYVEGSVYFATFRLKQGEFSPAEKSLVLEKIKSGDGRYYWLVAVVVMSDHVHVVLAPEPGIGLRKVLKGMKGVSAREINLLRGTVGSVWLDESFDRVVRDQEEFDEKLNYMLNNPAKKGLVEDGWEYPWWYVNEKSVSGGGDGGENRSPEE